MSDNNKLLIVRPPTSLVAPDAAERLAERLRLAHRAFNPNPKPPTPDTHRAG